MVICSKKLISCEYKYFGKTTEFFSMNFYNKFLVGYITNITNFKNIVLFPKYLYRLSTNKKQIVMLDNREIKFNQESCNIFDFETLKLQMSCDEIYCTANKLIFNCRFQNIFTHSSLSSTFVLILYIMITVFSQTKKKCA